MRLRFQTTEQKLEINISQNDGLIPSDVFAAMIDALGYHDALFHFMEGFSRVAQAKESNHCDELGISGDLADLYHKHFPDGLPPQGSDGWLDPETPASMKPENYQQGG
jgi:hypothetical protein